MLIWYHIAYRTLWFTCFKIYFVGIKDADTYAFLHHSQYLKRRYKSVALRKLATMVTLLTLAIYMGMCLYAPSLALSTVTSLSTIASMAIMGAIVTFYITIVSGHFPGSRHVTVYSHFLSVKSERFTGIVSRCRDTSHFLLLDEFLAKSCYL